MAKAVVSFLSAPDFIGANFIRYYLTHDKSAYIVNLDKLTYAGSLSKLINLPDDKRYKFIQGDIIDTKLVTKILAEHTIGIPTVYFSLLICQNGRL